jgi:hypothetical protein
MKKAERMVGAEGTEGRKEGRQRKGKERDKKRGDSAVTNLGR